MSRDDTDLDEAEAPDDLRSMLESAVAAREQSAPDAEPAEPSSGTRMRGSDGKFAKAESAPEPAETEAAPVSAEEPAKPDVEKDKPAAEKAIEAPANWSETDKAAFKGLPPDAQNFLLKRHTAMETDYTRKTQEIASIRREYEPIAQIFAPHAEAMKQSGYTPATLVQAWANVERELQQGRGIGVVKSLVDGYKMDRQQVAQALGLTAPTAAPGVDAPPPASHQPIQLPPEIAAKLQTYDQFIANQQREREAEAARQQQQDAARVMGTIEQFSAAKGPDGALLHPYFADVEEGMTRLAIAARTRGEAVPPLDELYDQAVWANPSTRAKILEAKNAADQAQRTAKESKRIEEAKAKAAKAKRAGSSVTGNLGPGQSAGSSNDSASLRATLMAAAEEYEAA